MNFIDRLKSRRLIFGLIIVIVLAVIGGVLVTRHGGRDGGDLQTAKQADLYQCPMHPTYTSDRPGDCPICGMRLVKVGDEDGDVELHGIEGLAGIRLSAKRQLIGVRSVEAEMVSLTKAIRTVGVIEPDETRLSIVNMKIDGWIEKLNVNYTGQLITRGQPLLSIYSQELLATQEEYLLALRAQERLRTNSFPEVARNSAALAARARQRLRLWDVPESEIRALESSGRPRRTMTLRSPVTGFVMHRNVTEGMFANAGQELYQIADLSRIWVQADVYEYELGLVRVGQRARLTVNAYPGRVWHGQVKFINPFLDDQSRTAKVRFEFPNAGFDLKPNMYANVELDIPLGIQLVVPEEAILDSGTRQVVFVDVGDGIYEPREVQVGHKAEGKVAITFGLFEGERVVTNGNFMIDAESRLKSALSDMTGPPDDDGHVGH